MGLGVEPVVLGLGGVLLLAEAGGPLPCVASRSAASLALPIDLGDLVGLAVQLLDLVQLLPPSRFELDEPIDVALDAAVRAVLFDEVGVFDDEFAVEHIVGQA